MKAYKEIIKLSLPIFFFRLLVSLNTFIGIIFISRLGKLPLAASLISYSIYMAVFLASFTILISVGISVSRFFGAKQYDKISEVFQNGLGLAFLIACVASFILWNFKYVLIITNQNPVIISLSDAYLKYTALGLFASLWVCVFNQFNNAIGRTRIIHIANFCILPLSVVLGYCFLFGALGFPKLGMPGYALGTTIGNACVAIGLWIYHLTEKKTSHLTKSSFKPYFKLSVYKRLVKMGIPISVQSAGELLAFSISTIFMGWFGSNALAAQQIVLQATILANMFAFSISQGTAVVVGHAIGEKNIEKMLIFMKKGLKLTMLFSLIMAIAFLMFSRDVVSFYMAHSSLSYIKVYPLARLFLVIASIMLIFDAVRFFSSSALRVMHDLKLPMWATIVSFGFFALPLAYMLAFTFSLGPIGIRIGFLIAAIMAAISISLRLYLKVKHQFDDQKSLFSSILR